MARHLWPGKPANGRASVKPRNEHGQPLPSRRLRRLGAGRKSPACTLSRCIGTGLGQRGSVTHCEGFCAPFQVSVDVGASGQLGKSLQRISDGSIQVELDMREFERFPIVQANLKEGAGETCFRDLRLTPSGRQCNDREAQPRLEAAILNELRSFDQSPTCWRGRRFRRPFAERAPAGITRLQQSAGFAFVGLPECAGSARA